MNVRVTPFWKAVVIALTVIGVLIAMNQAFFWNPGGISLLKNAYMYAILAAFLPIVFIIFPVHKSLKDRPVPVYDTALVIITMATCLYFAGNSENIVTLGWDYAPVPLASVLSFVFWALVLEALRRTAGLVVTIIALVFSLYPIFTAYIPVPFLQGIPFDIKTAAQIHAMGVDSILGLPLQTGATILVGFLLFGVALQHSGGATFFYELAMGLFGRYRGGSAKVAVISSAFMGMMSGSAVSNVLTTGPMTIPAMKKAGFTGRYAAGIEATAATGGTITPPIMGSAAFLMVSFVGVPYGQIALAAVIPALLYYIGIFVQADAYSAKTGLKGIAKNLLPNVGKVIVFGWAYLFALIGLVLLLVIQKNESQAPYWVVAFLLIVAISSKKYRMGLKGFGEFLYSSGKTIAEILGIIAGVGLIVGGLSMTGVSLSLARELVNAFSGNLILVLIAAAITSFVLGMGMTVSAVYVFLAIVMAPALVELGVNPIAGHLFVIYWATVSYITPPVALASFAAANIAGTPPMQTSLTAMRLGAVKYVVPFAFALNPALVAQAPLPDILVTFAFAVVGVFFLGCAFEGWLVFVNRRPNWVIRALLIVAGVLTFAPVLTYSAIGLVLGAAGLLITRFWNKGGQTSTREVDKDAAAEEFVLSRN